MKWDEPGGVGSPLPDWDWDCAWDWVTQGSRLGHAWVTLGSI